MVAAQFFPGSGRAAHSLAQKSRVCNEAPAHHDARQSRKCRFQCPQVIRGGHIAVVADRSSAGGQVGSKGFPVGLAAVELFHHPGVDGQLAEGVFVVNVQDLPELLRPGHTQPGLDRHRPACLRKDSVQKGIQLLRIPEHSGTLALGCHGAGGTPEVQVDLGIAHPAQFPDHPGRKFAVLCQQLRDDLHSRVGRRFQLSHLLFDEHPVLRRREKRRIVPHRGLRCTEPALVGLPPDAVCQPLHRGGVVVHNSSPWN